MKLFTQDKKNCLLLELNEQNVWLVSQNYFVADSRNSGNFIYTVFLYCVQQGTPSTFHFLWSPALPFAGHKVGWGEFKNTNKASKSCISSAVCQDALLMACVAIKHDFTWIKHANRYRYRSACIYVNAFEFINGGEMLKFGHWWL